jgi:hypothetical protein
MVLLADDPPQARASARRRWIAAGAVLGLVLGVALGVGLGVGITRGQMVRGGGGAAGRVAPGAPLRRCSCRGRRAPRGAGRGRAVRGDPPPAAAGGACLRAPSGAGALSAGPGRRGPGAQTAKRLQSPPRPHPTPCTLRRQVPSPADPQEYSEAAQLLEEARPDAPPAPRRQLAARASRSRPSIVVVGDGLTESGFSFKLNGWGSQLLGAYLRKVRPLGGREDKGQRARLLAKRVRGGRRRRLGVGPSSFSGAYDCPPAPRCPPPPRPPPQADVVNRGFGGYFSGWFKDYLMDSVGGGAAGALGPWLSLAWLRGGACPGRGPAARGSCTLASLRAALPLPCSRFTRRSCSTWPTPRWASCSWA